MSEVDVFEQVKVAILRGWQRPQVDALIARISPEMTPAAIDRLYATAMEGWLADASRPDGEIYALAVARREDMYRKAHAEGDTALAFKIQCDLDKLQQQYRTEKRAEERKSSAAEIAERIRAKRRPLTAVGGTR
ncbi:MAG: hypothetical protein EOM21_19015 [Gammaproteobacteria bacterium]|nr:hypothetical protein [Gammaproteobacteria bacterium]